MRKCSAKRTKRKRERKAERSRERRERHRILEEKRKLWLAVVEIEREKYGPELREKELARQGT